MSRPEAEAIILLISSESGIYIPQRFVSEMNLEAFSGLPEDISDLDDPDSDTYWDTWISVLDNATHTSKEGHEYRLWQDGDLFLVCDKLMSDEEYLDFYEEDRS